MKRMSNMKKLVICLSNSSHMKNLSKELWVHRLYHKTKIRLPLLNLFLSYRHQGMVKGRAVLEISTRNSLKLTILLAQQSFSTCRGRSKLNNTIYLYRRRLSLALSTATYSKITHNLRVSFYPLANSHSHRLLIKTSIESIFNSRMKTCNWSCNYTKQYLNFHISNYNTSKRILSLWKQLRRGKHIEQRLMSLRREWLNYQLHWRVKNWEMLKSVWSTKLCSWSQKRFPKK